jgi:UDP-N-acetylglucosamine transferase subunit ALG13
MILVSVGTNEQPFDRLLEAVGVLRLDERVIAQVALSTVRPAGAECHAYLPFDELAGLARGARHVVTHAGVGSIALALDAGRRPIVMARLRDRGEAVDDHQEPFARRLAAAELVRIVEDADGLRQALAERSPRRAGLGSDATALAAELGLYLRDEVGVRLAGALR